MALIEVEQVNKQYGQGETAVHALRQADLKVQPGEFLAVIGPSGSGKSTLLHLIGGVDRPTSGHIRVGDQSLEAMS